MSEFNQGEDHRNYTSNSHSEVNRFSKRTFGRGRDNNPDYYPRQMISKETERGNIGPRSFNTSHEYSQPYGPSGNSRISLARGIRGGRGAFNGRENSVFGGSREGGRDNNIRRDNSVFGEVRGEERGGYPRRGGYSGVIRGGRPPFERSEGSQFRDQRRVDARAEIC